jgi:hypothetical protein
MELKLQTNSPTRQISNNQTIKIKIKAASLNKTTSTKPTNKLIKTLKEKSFIFNLNKLNKMQKILLFNKPNKLLGNLIMKSEVDAYNLLLYLKKTN